MEVSDADAQMYGWGITVNRSGDGQGFIINVIHNWGGSITDAGMTQLIFDSRNAFKGDFPNVVKL